MIVTRGYGSRGGIITRGYGWFSGLIAAVIAGGGALLNIFFDRLRRKEYVEAILLDFFDLRKNSRRKRFSIQMKLTPQFDIKINSPEVVQNPFNVTVSQ